MPDLTRKAGPLPVWGWIVLAGGGLGIVLLVKHSKGGAPTEGEPIPESLVMPGQGDTGVGTVGAGGGESKEPLAGEHTQGQVEPVRLNEGSLQSVLSGLSELEAAGYHKTVAGEREGSNAAQTAASLQHSKGGNPRAGIPFKPGTYKGHAAHIYSRPVTGGVGPGHNVIVVPGPGKKTHAKKGQHQPAHTKAQHPAAAHHAAPKRTPAKAKGAPRLRRKTRI